MLQLLNKICYSFFFVNLSHFKCCIVLYFGWFVLMFDLMDWSFVTRDADKLIAYICWVGALVDLENLWVDRPQQKGCANWWCLLQRHYFIHFIHYSIHPSIPPLSDGDQSGWREWNKTPVFFFFHYLLSFLKRQTVKMQFSNNNITHLVQNLVKSSHFDTKSSHSQVCGKQFINPKMCLICHRTRVPHLC